MKLLVLLAGIATVSAQSSQNQTRFGQRLIRRCEPVCREHFGCTGTSEQVVVTETVEEVVTIPAATITVTSVVTVGPTPTVTSTSETLYPTDVPPPASEFETCVARYGTGVWEKDNGDVCICLPDFGAFCL